MKTRNLVRYLAFLLIPLAAASAPAESPGVLHTGNDLRPWAEISRDVRALGGRVLQAFPPAGAIIEGDAPFWSAARRHSGWTPVTPGAPLPIPSDAPRTERFLLSAWNYRFAPPARTPAGKATEEPPMEHAAPGPRGDPGPMKAPPGGNFFDTSEFFLGSVAIGILMPESNGIIDPSTEDWTQAEIDSVVAEVQAGLTWWISKAPGGNLSFVIDVPDPIPCPYEAITRGAFVAQADTFWTRAIFDTLGYGTGDAWFRGRSYINGLRDTYGTDWAVAVIVVDSKNDVDGKFASGVYGFSYYGGPYLAMAYDCGSQSVAALRGVTAHEIGHSFYALDEYYSAHKGCTLKAGYLLVSNQNSEYGICTTDDPCILRNSVVADFDSNHVCPYTLGQVGMRDADTDDIADILDTYPSTTMNAVPDTTIDATPTVAGSTWVNPLVNWNTIGEGNDITLNTIAAVEYRVSGGPWLAADAADGIFDSTGEAYSFTTEPLAQDSLYVFEARAVNSAGNADTVVVADTIYILDGTAPAVIADLAAAAADSFVTLTWTNPPDADLQSAVIRYSTVAPPADTTEGTLLEVRAAAPGAPDTLVHGPLLPDTTYYYAIFALDEKPNVSAPATAPARPLYPLAPAALHQPAMGELHVAALPTFAWSPVALPDPSDTLIAYGLQIALDSIFTGVIVDTEATTGAPADTLWSGALLDEGTPYWWRVRGKDQSSGTWGYWSDVGSFTTELAVTAIAFLDSSQSACTNFADGDSLEANADALVEVRIAPADTLGLGGFEAWVHWYSPTVDSSALALDRNEGGFGYWRGAIPYGSAFARGDTVTFYVSVRSPNHPSMADDKSGAGYAFVAARRALPGWHVPDSAEPVFTMREPYHPLDTDTAITFRVGSPLADAATGGEVIFHLTGDGTYGVVPLAADTTVGDSVYHRAFLDSSFVIGQGVEYYFRVWGAPSCDTTYLYGSYAGSSATTILETALASPFSFVIESATGIDEIPGAAIPRRNALFANQPNPFNPTTAIPFALAATARVNLVLYDARGRVVRTLVDETRPAGWHSVVWNATTDRGADAPSGIYFAVIRTDTWRETMKLLLLR